MSIPGRNPCPATVLVETSGCRGGSGDFLRFLLKKRSICVLAAWGKEETKGVDPQRGTYPLVRQCGNERARSTFNVQPSFGVQKNSY